MTNTARGLNQFFSGFGIPAYEENSVPDDAVLPYITYQLQEPNWDDVGSIAASVWYKGTGYKDLFAKVDEIKAYVGEGIRIPVKAGECLYIFKDSPFAQIQPSQSDTVKVAYLLFGLHALCN